MREEALPGGNLSPVVRLGDTVRRSVGPWTPAVHSLLRYLEAHGFDGAPRVLGFDEQDREVLSFIEGGTDSSGDPSWVWSTTALIEAAQLIRRYHDLCRNFQPPANALWQVMVGAPVEGEIICHNDLAPYNTVFRNGVPVAFIDWDLAAPGPALWDVAYAAWRFVPLYNNPRQRGWPSELSERATRLRLFCDAYQLDADERSQLVPMIERRITCAFDTLRVWGREGKPGWSEMWHAGSRGDGMLRDLTYVHEHQHNLADAIA